MTRLVLAAGTTETAAIEGLSAAGTDGDLLVHTPSADAEILEYGKPVRAPVTPVSPAGCPTPAVVTRAVRERLDLPLTVVDAGLAKPTAAGTVTVGATPGRDIREEEPVPTAYGVWEAARQFGRALDEDLLLAETVPGGTTTALGVLTALGETDATGVSSSLAANPLDLKREVVAAGLDASDLDAGSCAGQPRRAVRRMGDPTAAVLGGLTVGALETDTPVTLAGGTQLLAVAALARHADADGRLSLATTSFIDADPNVDLSAAADAFELDVTVTDPGFDESHVAFERYLAGEAKEGVGMGGALAVADAAGVPMADVRDGVISTYERLLG
ncbi:nicotinate-nucleotide--dimethylbenzimidazole phosphoribosyltransferase family protein [Halosegnis longus]|uniref:nicotinate-nucleotide--dimethylbenzimidazole phosphoribosyltransferase n=1 Tax=Halosegnis longus TaxID=2216012 RepID=UPI00096AAAED|nr:nicotinate-nucleotide--dimethylbenzimidazole phosphoribosyltransferase [Salella cibi]